MLCLCNERTSDEGFANGCPLCRWERLNELAGKGFAMSPERAENYCRMAEFIQSLLDPEQFGWAVTEEVRQRARRALPQLRPEPKPIEITEVE